jgi:cell division protein ZapB
MTQNESYQSPDLKELEKKLDQLIDLYNTVKSENELLKNRQDTLVREKAQLVEKTALARNRVEAMISRLRTMGQS